MDGNGRNAVILPEWSLSIRMYYIVVFGKEQMPLTVKAGSPGWNHNEDSASFHPPGE